MAVQNQTIIEVSNLRKVFKVGFRRKQVTAVHDISFNVKKGEIFGIVGPNGAGKTTTIKILTGLLRPSSGSASLFGIPSSEVSSREKLGYLPEGPYFYEHLKVEELLIYYGLLTGISRADAKAKAQELITLVGLEDATRRPLKKFSKGMRQRAGLAQALINDPELVILDEPQSGLDPVGRRDVRELILTLKDQGKTVVFSSHILPDVEAVCDRVALFHKGRVVEIGALQEVLNQNTQAIEVVVTGLPLGSLEELPGTLNCTDRAGFFFLDYPPDIDVVKTLQQIEAKGGRVQSVTPKRENLEHVFMRDTQNKEESVQ